MLKAWISCLALLATLGVAWAGGQININKAGPEALADAIHGVGPVKAKAIVREREANGPFKDVDGLARVNGIGSETIRQNRDVLTVDGAGEAL